jgi:hypothetical protein
MPIILYRPDPIRFVYPFSDSVSYKVVGLCIVIVGPTRIAVKSIGYKCFALKIVAAAVIAPAPRYVYTSAGVVSAKGYALIGLRFKGIGNLAFFSIRFALPIIPNCQKMPIFGRLLRSHGVSMSLAMGLKATNGDTKV